MFRLDYPMVEMGIINNIEIKNQIESHASASALSMSIPRDSAILIHFHFILDQNWNRQWHVTADIRQRGRWPPPKHPHRNRKWDVSQGAADWLKAKIVPMVQWNVRLAKNQSQRAEQDVYL